MKTIYPLLMLSLLIGTASCHKSDKEQKAGVPEIEVAEPMIDSVTLHKTYPGIVYSTDNADVVGRVNGEILSVHFKGGERVKKGQLLFVIDSSTYRDAVAQAEATLATQRSKYEYASKQLAAMQKALQSNAVSQMDVIQATADRNQAAAAIKDAQAALNTARTQLGYCRVVAPISGTIATPSLDVGSYVGGEGSPVVLTSIFDENALAVRFNIEDTQYEQMLGHLGGLKNPLMRAVPVTFNKPLPHSYTIDMYYESPSVDTSTGTLTMKGSIKNIDYELRDGMYCTVHLPYGIEPKAILVKDASISTDQLGKYLYTVNDSNKVVYTHIEIGELYQDSLRIVTSGLKPGQKYVTKAMLNVRNGEEVKPKTVK